MKQLTLSIVIPVYNEERHIARCLEAIQKQTVPPLEVIVVDNNCTDQTVTIARTFPGVRVIKESKQGRTPARNTGFNAAKGDIIGRIDADSILLPNWVERVIQDFSDNDIDGVTGPAQTLVFLYVNGLYSTFWSRIYFWATHAVYRAVTMWGANMAIRRSAWQRIKNHVAKDGAHFHEDIDVSITLAAHGGRIMQDNTLNIRTEGDSLLYFPKFMGYFTKDWRMYWYYRQHGILDKIGERRLSFWQVLPGGIVGWFFTGLFFIYALLSWPIIAIFYKRRERARIRQRIKHY